MMFGWGTDELVPVGRRHRGTRIACRLMPHIADAPARTSPSGRHPARARLRETAMSSPHKTSGRTETFQLTLLIFAVIAFMYFTGEVLKPLALAVLSSFALAPAARFLERRGLPRVAAVILTVVLSLGALGGIGYVVVQQLTSLARRLPDYQENIEAKLRGVINPGQKSAAGRLRDLADEVTAKMEKPSAAQPGEAAPIQKVEVVSRPSFQDQLRSATGPYVEFLGVGSFVLILVLFILVGREGLSDRIVGLFGHRQVSLTTRTMQEIGQRISRYLATFALVNSGFGLVIGVGLWLIGVPYAVLWGCLAAMLRFIPYVGPAVAFIMPLVFSFAISPAGPGHWKSSPCSRSSRPRLDQLPGAGHLRQDDGCFGPGPARRRHVLDLALGDAGAAPVDPADGLPGGAGQVCAQPLVLRRAPERRVRAGPRCAALPAARGPGSGGRRRSRRGGVEAATARRGLRWRPGAGVVAGRTRRRAGRAG